MAGRNRMPRHPDIYRDDPRPILHHGPPHIPPHPAELEEELELQHQDIQRLLSDNRHVIDDNVMLQRNLDAVKDEIHRLNQVLPELKSDKEAHRRELIDRGLKLEGELRLMEPIRDDVARMRAEAQKLTAVRQDLSSKSQTLKKDLNRLQTENKEIGVMKSDIDKMHKELADARRAFEYEKKGNEDLLEENRAMERNLISMAREIEKLHAERTSADIRARAGIGGYEMMLNGPETRYLDPYSASDYGAGSGFWASYENRGGPTRR